jgi:hypothetical protein
MHLVAELSNPFVIIRSVLKIRKMSEAYPNFYSINENIFGASFVFLRLFVTPVLVVLWYEAENCIYSTKILISFTLFIQLFWVYRIIDLFM